MSSLGIRFVLPYVGLGGIVVKDNTISIPPTAQLYVQSITIDASQTDTINEALLILCNANNGVGMIQGINYGDSDPNLDIDAFGSIDNSSTTGNITTNSIRTTAVDASAPRISFDTYPDSSGNLDATLDGSQVAIQISGL